MDPAFRPQIKAADVLIFETNTLIAADLKECLLEIDPEVAVVTAHTLGDAKSALASDVAFGLAIVPGKALSDRNAEFCALLLARAEYIAIHGDIRGSSLEGEQFFYLESPFTSATVRDLIGKIIVS